MRNVRGDEAGKDEELRTNIMTQRERMHDQQDPETDKERPKSETDSTCYWIWQQIGRGPRTGSAEATGDGVIVDEPSWQVARDDDDTTSIATGTKSVPSRNAAPSGSKKNASSRLRRA